MRKNLSAQIRRPEILEAYYQTIIEEGLEGASIGKVAARMNIHPSLIIHYFKTKNNMTIDLVELIIEKFEAPHLLDFTSETDPARRLDRLLDVIFSKEWSKSVDIRVFFAFYYLSFREPVIRERFEAMFRRFRDHLAAEFELAHEHGLIQTDDRTAAADAVVTLMEGMEFHAAFLAEGRPFEAFAALAKGMAWDVLLGRVATASGPPGGSGMSISQAN